MDTPNVVGGKELVAKQSAVDEQGKPRRTPIHDMAFRLSRRRYDPGRRTLLDQVVSPDPSQTQIRARSSPLTPCRRSVGGETYLASGAQASQAIGTVVC
jgi:hypothetical protein